MPKAVGNAVVRNRIKRQLREIWRAKLDQEAIDPVTNDYVLVVRQGCPRRPRRTGTSGCSARVDEVLGKAAA